jgi:phage baseplate assembly protein W
MADGKTYGLTFPFVESYNGKYLDLSDYPAEEIRSNLIHLLLTRKGTRYFLPDFGTALLEYIFEPLDGPTFKNIESEIRDSVEKFMPQLQLTNISITAPTGEAVGATVTTAGNVVNPELQMTNQDVTEYTATVRIDYSITNDVFNTKDFIILNI